LKCEFEIFATIVNCDNEEDVMKHTFINKADVEKIARKFWYLVDCAGCEFAGDCDGIDEDCVSFWSSWVEEFNNSKQM
jgi:hypothetical protein